jgi:hypothetical protein
MEHLERQLPHGLHSIMGAEGVHIFYEEQLDVTTILAGREIEEVFLISNNVSTSVLPTRVINFESTIIAHTVSDAYGEVVLTLDA